MAVLSYEQSVDNFNLEHINSEIERFWEVYELPENRLFSILIVVEEIVTNIMKYGVQAREKRKISVRVENLEKEIVVVVRDNTVSYNPLLADEPDTKLSAEDREIGGLGLFIVGKMVQSSTYKHLDGENYFEAIIKI